jgi:hypothetical protein
MIYRILPPQIILLLCLRYNWWVFLAHGTSILMCLLSGCIQNYSSVVAPAGAVGFIHAQNRLLTGISKFLDSSLWTETWHSDTHIETPFAYVLCFYPPGSSKGVCLQLYTCTFISLAIGRSRISFLWGSVEDGWDAETCRPLLYTSTVYGQNGAIGCRQCGCYWF